MILYVDMLNVLSHISRKIPSEVVVRHEGAVAGEGKLVDERNLFLGVSTP